MRVLVVEDETVIADFLRRGLAEAGYAVDLATNGEEALDWALTYAYDAVILDWMLPRGDGASVCRELRHRDIRVPILMLTARDTVEDRVAGLDAGVDDYLVKPFAFAELLARLRALLRRAPLAHDVVLAYADLRLDPATRGVTRAGQPIVLTTKEYSLLEYLLRNANQALTRSQIAEHVWSDSFDALTNVIDVHIAALRRKIDDRFAPRLIHTVRNIGYRLGEE